MNEEEAEQAKHYAEMQTLYELTEPLVKWMQENQDIHDVIIISQLGFSLFEGKHGRHTGHAKDNH